MMHADHTTQRADWTVDQRWSDYTPAQHDVWKTLFERQSKPLPGRACDEFIAGMRTLPIDSDKIPNFEQLSKVLMKHTEWRVVAVPGLVPDDVFFEHLANRLPCWSIDSASEPARLFAGTGRLPRRLRSRSAIDESDHGRVHPGLRPRQPARQGEGGAGSAGSRVLVHGRVWPGQATRWAAHLRRRHRVFLCRVALRTGLGLAETHTVRPELLGLANRDFSSLYETVKLQTSYEPGTVLPQDRLLSTGVGSYHALKRLNATAAPSRLISTEGHNEF